MFGAVEVRGDLATVLAEICRALGRRTRRSWWLWQHDEWFLHRRQPALAR